MCGFGAPTFGTAKPRLPEGWALTAHAPRAAFPTQSRSTHRRTAFRSVRILASATSSCCSAALEMVAVPLANVGMGRVLAFCACASKCLPMKSGRSEGGNYKVMDARVAAVRGSVSGCIC